MRPDLHADITRRLKLDYAFKVKGTWLREGKCPYCNKRELYTKEESPWVLRCGRLNQCGEEIHVKEIYRDLFENWSERFVRTETNPHAAADAYLMHARGFPLTRLHGLYSQELHQDRERNITSATVRFPLPGGSWWERYIDRPERFGKRKAGFAYGKSMQGQWWSMPDSAADASELWLTEGIFDTIALELAGKASRALLSCNNYPEYALAELAKACTAAGRDRPALVWALDDGPAGKSYMRKWHERAVAEGWKSRAAYTPDKGALKQDWNELWLRSRLDDAALDDARYHGDLLLAPSAMAKALLMYKRKERGEFHFGFNNQLYWFRLDVDKYNKAKQDVEKDHPDLAKDEQRDLALKDSGTVIRIANCYPQALYYQRNDLTDESWYYFRISFPHAAKPIKTTFTASQLAMPAQFKVRIMDVAGGASFTGNAHQLDAFYEDSTYAIKTVETVPYIGYSRDHGAWIFGDIAVKGGAVYPLNDEDYFDIGRISVKSLNQSLGLTINPDDAEYRHDWVDLIWHCYGSRGLVALVFWAGSLFAEQIRGQHKQFPFLEMSGEAGTGKSTLITFLWKLVGRTGHEGIDASKSSLAGRMRHYTQVSNLPVVLTESDRDEDSKLKKFDMEELKSMFDGHIGRSIGVKNSGNDTYDPPFRGSLVIEQNAPVIGSEALMSRIVQMTFDKSLHSPENKHRADKLHQLGLRDVSGFTLRATRAENAVMEQFNDLYPRYVQSLLQMPDIKMVRIAETHAAMMALVDGFQPLLKLNDEQLAAVHGALTEMAKARQLALNADHKYVQQFWELFDFLDGKPRGTHGDRVELNHSRSDGFIAINLVQFEAEVAAARLQMPATPSDMKTLLRTSRVRKFVDANKAINSAITSRTTKCWVFKMERD